MQLEGKVALITGGGTGIGAALARRFVGRGRHACASPGAARRSSRRWPPRCPPAAASRSPATCASRRTRGAWSTRRSPSPAGSTCSSTTPPPTSPAPSSTWTWTTWQEMLDTNLTGTFLLMKAAIPPMIAAGGGSIINMASLAGVRCVPGSPGYCATKAGIIHLTKQVALDYGKDGIRCNVRVPRACPHRDARVQPDADGGGHGDRHRRGLRGAAQVRAAAPRRLAGGDRRPLRLPGQRRLGLHDRLDHHDRRRHPLSWTRSPPPSGRPG